MSKRGFSLLELILAMLLLGIMFAVVFALFGMSTGAFNYTLTRQNLQNEGRRVMAWLDTDFRQTDSHSVGVSSDNTRRIMPQNYPRHGISFAGVKDWNRTDALEMGALRPDWDHYVVYYATREKPYGRLIRAILEPPPALISGQAFDDFVNNPSAFLNDDPSLNNGYQSRYETLATTVERFAITNSRVISGLNFQLVLKQNSRRVEPSKSSNQGFEIHFDITPENTRPRR